MSTLVGIVVGLLFGGWVVVTILRLGAYALLATAVAAVLGLAYGVVQIVLEIPWSDDLVLFWSVYGLLGIAFVGYKVIRFVNVFVINKY